MNTNDYNALTDFILRYGLNLSCSIIIFGLICVLVVYWFWLACLIDVFNKDPKEFQDRTLWIILLLVSFFIPGIIWQLIASAIYYVMYKPKLKFWE